MNWLTRVIDSIRRLFDYTGRRKAAQAEVEAKLALLHRDAALAQAAQHEHTLEMVETIMSRMEGIFKANSDASGKQAEAFTKNAEALQVWFEMFRSAQGEGSVSIVRPEDEAEQEHQREIARLKKAGFIPEDDAASNVEASAFLGKLFSPPPAS